MRDRDVHASSGPITACLHQAEGVPGDDAAWDQVDVQLSVHDEEQVNYFRVVRKPLFEIACRVRPPADP